MSVPADAVLLNGPSGCVPEMVEEQAAARTTAIARSGCRSRLHAVSLLPGQAWERVREAAGSASPSRSS